MRIAKQGWPFVIGCFIVGTMLLELGKILHQSWPAALAGVAFLAAVYCAYLFRDPPRVIPGGRGLILSPADGKVMQVGEMKEGDSTIWIIRIFLSVFDPHLQRAPMAGKIESIRYTQGKFLDARDPQAHFENEQNRVEMTAQAVAGKITLVITQIAGLIARRIVCWARQGETLAAGQQFGLIRFGSQVDITFPISAKVRVNVGDRVKAGETILAEVAG
jgi:phosphatidylserine decarboxylase